MVQPAPRSSTAPVPNSASIAASGRAPGGAASAIDQKQGHARSQVPGRNVKIWSSPEGVFYVPGQACQLRVTCRVHKCAWLGV